MQTSRERWADYLSNVSLTELPGVPSPGMLIDLDSMRLPVAWLEEREPEVTRAFAEMTAIERGDEVNDDEKRRVGHYWLRSPERAPSPSLRQEIERTVAEVRRFAGDVHAGRIVSEKGMPFDCLLVVGIGGSALGPRLVADALSSSNDLLMPHFIDNTDPDGIDRVLDALEQRLERTLTLVISKSGGTKETRNGMLEVEARYRRRGLVFAHHAVAVTGAGSALDRQATNEHWLARFPMWDWVGGRTSEMSAVGLLPAALQGIDIDALLAGARAMDEATRDRPPSSRPLANPALALALAWHFAGRGHGCKAMVLLPYKDRLQLLARYLQQLVMESLGKRLDRAGRVVHQGLSVYGNKGSTDQHAYVQQLRDGPDNFFVTFVEVLRDRMGASMEVEPGVTAGDYLEGFLLGTRRALEESGRASLTITLPYVSPVTLGALIALYERAVGLYAGMIGVNAYHQPGVEAGKQAASRVIDLERRILECLRERAGVALSVDEIAATVGQPEEVVWVFKLLEHLAANPDRGIVRLPGGGLLDIRYRA